MCTVRSRRVVSLSPLLFAVFLCFGLWPVSVQGQEEAGDPPEILLGERLFLETRFAQSFKQFLHLGGRTNDPLPTGDPVMNTSVTIGSFQCFWTSALISSAVIRCASLL